jgi:biotin carboxylase
MRVLLTDGSGLTARQVATRLSASGHTVDVLSPDPLCLCRYTRHVHRVRRVPAFGPDPIGWLDAALDAYRSGHFDVLFPTQEQVAVLAAFPERLREAGVATAVPSFAALAAVQDKISAFATMRRLGIPQPETAVGPAGWETFPAFVKTPIGTASEGVRRVDSPEALDGATAGRGPVLVQAAADGPLAMCQAVFDRGTMVAFHACLRTGEGANGGASHKRSTDQPEARAWIDRLGTDLGWHGALSADVIVTPTGPLFIDINPRLVEPENAWRAGVDLVSALVALALGGHPAPTPGSRTDVRTHQLLLGLLGMAQRSGSRTAVLRELLAAMLGRGVYADSREELTPVWGDLFAVTPLVLAAASMLVRPRSWRWFTSGSVDNYALSGDGWEEISARAGGDAAVTPGVS